MRDIIKNIKGYVIKEPLISDNIIISFVELFFFSSGEKNLYTTSV